METQDARERKDIILVPEGQRAYFIDDQESLRGTHRRIIPLEETEAEKAKRMEAII
jgi:hypothetical protein